MDFKLVIAVIGVIVTRAASEINSESSTSEKPNIIPGVFISADALKSLQEKAKNPESNQEIPAKDEHIGKKSDQFFPDPEMNNQQVMDPATGNLQNYVPEQQTMYDNQPMLNQQPYGNQQATFMTQPAYQQPIYNQPPNNVQNGLGSQGMLVNPQGYIQNQQPYLVAQQQPGYQNPQGMLINQQPSYQQPLLVAQAPNHQQSFVPNGQLMQPNLVSNQNMLAQQPYNANGVMLASPVQGQSNMYTLVPVNGQTLQNPNLGNSNSYFVPLQQVPQNSVLLNSG